MRWLYSCLLVVLLPFIFMRLWWKGKTLPAYRQRWGERLGFYHTPLQAQSVWLHAVSVGELQAAVPLIKQLQQHYPQFPLLITTMTPTGSQRVKELFQFTNSSPLLPVQHVYLPYDTTDAVYRFLEAARPRLAILMETELWANLLDGCYQRKIPVLLLNARLSEQSARGYHKIAPFTQSMLQQINHIAAHHQEDAERFIALGAPAERVSVTGSIKFDLSIPSKCLQQAAELKSTMLNRPVWIAASTHEGEETAVLAAFSALLSQFPDLLLILVPRHPDRFEKVAGLCREYLGQMHRAEAALARRSLNQAILPSTVIYLGDTLGELLMLYATADIAFIGGSLVNVGGHNPLEAIAVGVPVIVGRYFFNFSAIFPSLFALQCATSVHDEQELVAAVSHWLTAPNQRQQAQQKGQQFIQANRGATEKMMQLIASYLN